MCSPCSVQTGSTVTDGHPAGTTTRGPQVSTGEAPWLSEWCHWTRSWGRRWFYPGLSHASCFFSRTLTDGISLQWLTEVIAVNYLMCKPVNNKEGQVDVKMEEVPWSSGSTDFSSAWTFPLGIGGQKYFTLLDIHHTLQCIVYGLTKKRHNKSSTFSRVVPDTDFAGYRIWTDYSV